MHKVSTDLLSAGGQILVKPQTIQIYLPGGDPQGIRVAELTTRIVQLIEVPRSLLADFLDTPESEQVALYFLVGEKEDSSNPQVYIGQTGSLRDRLKSHNQLKDFWERALVLISKTNSMTQTHALFLEWHCLQMAAKADRYGNENGNAGSRPYTPAPLEADCHEIFETGQTLLATLGHPIFEPVVRSVQTSDAQALFVCNARNASGTGQYTQEGFVVLKDSYGPVETMPSFQKSHQSNRLKLIQDGILKADGDRLMFTRDHLFGSPSGASCMLLGRSSNGWMEWKNKQSQTLHELKRGN